MLSSSKVGSRERLEVDHLVSQRTDFLDRYRYRPMEANVSLHW
jgi:hypothetical protein